MLLAKKLIDKAKASEQTQLNFKHLKLKDYLKNTPKVAYQKRSGSKNETHFEMLKKLELKEKDHVMLKKYCNKKKN